MVEQKDQIQEELNAAVIRAIENKMEFLDKNMEEMQARKIEEYEELKMKVKPKLVMVKRELADVEKIFKAF